VSLRVGPWSDAVGIGQLLALPGSEPPDRSGVDEAIADARRLGFTTVRTGALGPHETAPYEAAGFTVETTLVLLRHDLRRLERPGTVLLRRPRRSEWSAIARLDAAAFPPYWHFDERSLREACLATSSHRVRVTGRPLTGYAIIGRSGAIGFLQRLAVHPDHDGRGLGRLLVLDGLAWLRRRGATQVFVNTQRENRRAVELYERLGFSKEPTPLVILALEIPPAVNR